MKEHPGATLLNPMMNRTNESLADAIIRLRKLPLDSPLQEKIDEAWELLHGGRDLEAEALIENVSAQARDQHADSPPADPVSTDAL